MKVLRMGEKMEGGADGRTDGENQISNLTLPPPRSQLFPFRHLVRRLRRSCFCSEDQGSRRDLWRASSEDSEQPPAFQEVFYRLSPTTSS